MINGYFKWTDALSTADFRASMTRRRYRVHWDSANRVWTITELVEGVRRGKYAQR